MKTFIYRYLLTILVQNILVTLVHDIISNFTPAPPARKAPAVKNLYIKPLQINQSALYGVLRYCMVCLAFHTLSICCTTLKFSIDTHLQKKRESQVQPLSTFVSADFLPAGRGR